MAELLGQATFITPVLNSSPGWGEVISLYLLPEYVGKGCGKRLLETAVTLLGIGIYLGMLLGLAIGSCIKEEGSSEDNDKK